MSARSDPSRTEAAPRIRGWRKWVLRAVLAIAAPLLVLGALELGLRIFGYGQASTFLLPYKPTQSYHRNPRFAWLFAPRRIAPSGEPVVVPMHKAPAAIRIFILGESAALGTPDPAYSFSRFLEAMLRQRYPKERFEVINTAMTGISSHVILPIARESAGHEPDLFIIYMGNNEVIGPYGPSTVFEAFSPSLTAIRLGIAVRGMRTGQLLHRLLGGDPDKGPKEWNGMAMFASGQMPVSDPRRQKVYDHFRANLSDIIAAGRSAGAGVIACTMGANLGDCAPFASIHKAGLNTPAWEQVNAPAVAAQQAKEWERAIAGYRRALALDDTFAETHFRLGQCLAETGDHAGALGELTRARDLDALQFRTDSRLNGMIRDVVKQLHDARVTLVDVEKAVAASDLADHGIPGRRIFWEHVHYRPEGNYLVARTLLPAVEAVLGERLPKPGTQGVASLQQCEAALALTPYDRHRIAGQMTEMQTIAPFTSQAGHAERIKALKDELHAGMVLESQIEQSGQMYEAAIEARPDDWHLHMNFTDFLMATGDLTRASTQLGAVMGVLPDDQSTRTAHAMLMGLTGQHQEAVTLLQALEAERPGNAPILKAIADNYMAMKEMPRAVELYTRAIAIRPMYASAYLNLGTALGAQNDAAGAASNYRKAIEIDDEPDAHFNLGVLVMHQGKLTEALAEFRRAVQLRPKDPRYRNMVAAALIQQRRPQEAVVELQEAIRISPKHSKSLALLAQLMAMKGDARQAVDLMKRSLENGPRPVENLIFMALTLSTHPDPSIRDGAAAVGYAEEACKATEYKSVDALEALGAALAENRKYDQAVRFTFEALQYARQQKLPSARISRLNYALTRYKSNQPYHP